MKGRTLLGAALAAVLMFNMGQAVSDDNITMRFANATNQAAKDAGVAMIKVVEEKSGGTITIEHYPDNMLGDDRVAIESTIMGDIDIVLAQPSTLTSFIPDMFVWDAPFLFPTTDDALRCFNSDIGKTINSLVEDRNLHYFTMVGNGFRNYTNNKIPVKVPADVKGAKVRVMESEIQMAQWKAWGANPTPMAFAEVLPALQQGTIDAQENPLAIIDSNKLYEVQHYISLTGHQFSPQILLMNQRRWNSLSDAQKEAMNEGVATFIKVQRERSLELDALSEQKFKDAGCEIVTLTADERQQWIDMAKEGGVYELVKSLMDNPEYVDRILNGDY